MLLKVVAYIAKLVVLISPYDSLAKMLLLLLLRHGTQDSYIRNHGIKTNTHHRQIHLCAYSHTLGISSSVMQSCPSHAPYVVICTTIAFTQSSELNSSFHSSSDKSYISRPSFVSEYLHPTMSFRTSSSSSSLK